MEITTVKEWLVAISTIVTLLSVTVGVWLSLSEYRIKLRAETQVAYGHQVENDIKLVKAFTEIMTIAHARSGYKVSEKAIEKILEPEMFKLLGGDKDNLNKLLQSNSVISLPVGKAAQDAAIISIGELGKRHNFLLPISIQALESIAEFRDEIANSMLDELKSIAVKSD